MTMPPVAASDANKSSNNTSTTTTATATKSSVNSKDTRLCHIVKRSDFDGYGFNLHSEKSKPGQFIGKIDANSPAESAGLKEGDQIIEVNGLPIGNETHKQVVQRIKAIAWEVKLLVTSEYPIDNNTKSSNKFIKQKMINEKKTIDKTSNNITSSISSDNSDISSKNSSPLSQHTNSINSPSTLMTTTTTTTTTATTTTTMTQNTSIIPSSSKSIEISSSENSITKANETLKLPSTAAEMRAILQSKKKYNPKSDEVNMQKKYDIIQKL